MRRILIPALVCLAVVTFAAGAHASALGLLYKDGITTNHLEDNDWEFWHDTDSSGTFNVGDLLIGMFEIQQIRDVDPGGKPVVPTTTNTFTGVFVVEVASVNTASPTYSGGADYTFTPTATNWSTLGYGLPVRTSTDSFTIVFDDSSSPFLNPNPAASTSVNDALATATDGTRLWEFGFAGGGSDPFELWLAQANGLSPLTVTRLDFQAALNITHTYAPALGLKILDNDFVFRGADGIGGPLGIYSQVQLTGSLEAPGVDDSRWFDIKTDADFYIKPTPEPGSLILLGLGLAACGGVVYRRRRNS